MSNSNKQTVRISGFGRRFLDAFKKKFGYTKNIEIAKELDLTDVAIGNYAGDRVPQLPILLKTVELTDCSLDWLLLDKEVEENKFDIEKFGGRNKFSKAQIESLKEIAERYKETLEEAVAGAAKNALVNAGLIDDENEIELIKAMMPRSSRSNEQRAKVRLTKDFLKDEEVRKEIWEMLEGDVRRIFNEMSEQNNEIDPFEKGVELAPKSNKLIKQDNENEKLKKAG
ncbi:MAG: hypothetical protein K1X72_04370 [Pyrinomonadaceae bacterium]|nr:hypothetical protein [Pyrinomonadaceae bacterium]